MSADPFSALPPRDPRSGLVNVVIDTPRGSANKYKYDEELHRSRTGTQEVRRIACEQIAKALDSLGGQSVTDGQVHAARKELKRARASLRLLRDALGKSV